MAKMKLSALKRGYNRFVNGAIVAAPFVAASTAHAEGIDLASATTQLGYGLAAVGALGALKVAPAALSWVWGMVTRNAAR
jgi:hypothetical protein